MHNQILRLMAISICGLSFAAYGGTEIKINKAAIDASAVPPVLTLVGTNFDAFSPLVVSVGGIILSAGQNAGSGVDCVILPTVITCDLGIVPVNSGETWTVGVSAGNGPSRNDEIDVAIPFETVPASCVDGHIVECYTGDPATLGVGICRAGTSMCQGGEFGACAGQSTPEPEVCDGLDNNCDGTVDEGAVCGCTDGDYRACYTGPQGSEGVGQCTAGVQMCSGGEWGACSGDITPTPEQCGDEIDNNCDGVVDESCPPV